MSIDSAPPKSKEYIRPIGIGWWLQRRRYSLYILREITCVAVGGYSFFLLLLVSRAGDEVAFADLVDSLRSPLSVVLHAVALLLVLYHAVTFLNAAPKAFVLWRGDQKVNPGLIVAAHYAGWLAVSMVVTWFALR